MKKSTILLGALMLLFIAKPMTAKYGVYYDKPKLNGHYFSLGIMDLDLKSFATFNLGYDAFFGDGKFKFSMEYANISNLKWVENLHDWYFDDGVWEQNGNVFSVVRSDKLVPKKFEIGGAFNFHQKMLRKDMPIPLYSYSAGYNTTVSVYAMRYIQVYRWTGIRAGFGHMRNLYFGAANTDDDFYDNFTISPAPPSGNFVDFATRFKHTYGYVGISRNSLYNIRVRNLPGKGKRSSYNNVYFDILFMMNHSIENVIDESTKVEYEVELKNEDAILNKVGWRFGVTHQGANHVSLGTLVEFGKFTGGSLIPKNVYEVTDFEKITNIINYGRIGFYVAITGPLQEQNLRKHW